MATSARLAALKARLDEQAKAKESPFGARAAEVSTTSPSRPTGTTTTTASTPVATKPTTFPTPLRTEQKVSSVVLQSKIEPLVNVLMSALEIPGPKAEFVEMLVKGVDNGFKMTSLRNTSVRSKLKGKVPAKNHELLETKLAKLQAANGPLTDVAMFLFSSIFEDKALAAMVSSVPPPPSTEPPPLPVSTTTPSAAPTALPDTSSAKALLMQRAAARVSLSAPMKSPPPPPKSSIATLDASIQPPVFDPTSEVSSHTTTLRPAATSTLTTSSLATAKVTTTQPVTTKPTTTLPKNNPLDTSSRTTTPTLSVNTSSVATTKPSATTVKTPTTLSKPAVVTPSISPKAQTTVPVATATVEAKSVVEAAPTATSAVPIKATQASALLDRLKKQQPFVQDNPSIPFHFHPADVGLLDLRYGDQIVLRTSSGLFMGLAPNGAVSSAYQSTFQFTVLHPKDSHDRSPVRFQHPVVLSCGGDNYLGFEASGLLKAKKGGDNTERWTLVSTSEKNLKSEGPVKIYDRVALRSSTGPFVACNAATCNLGGGTITALQTFELTRADLPLIAQWDRQRYHELNEATSSEKIEAKTIDQFNALSPTAREKILLEELLSALITLEGKYIVVQSVENNIPSYSVHKSVRDETLVAVLNRMLPVCTHYATLRNYINTGSRFEYGLVHQALCAVLRDVAQDFLMLVVQLERQFALGTLTLLRTWFYVQPMMALMERTAKLAKKAIHVRGGGLCTLIFESRQKEGNSRMREVYDVLLTKTCVPYFAMLANWIYQGTANDPYNEFQIHLRRDVNKENLNNFNDTYWDERFSVREENLPSFLEPSAQKILLTGKYLNVVRECGRTIKSPFKDEELKFSFNSRDYEDAIQAAYIFACRELLHIVMVEEKLSDRLRSLKRYFFLQQGDFVNHFMDIAEIELDRPVVDTAAPKLASLLELALRTSNAVSDPFADNLSCALQKVSLVDKLNAIHNPETKTGDNKPKQPIKQVEGLTLTYQVRFPVTLIISKKALTKYQLVFRLLISCKHVERQLERTWLQHQSTKELQVRAALHKSFALRYRMLSFWQNLSYYFTAEVLEPNFCELMGQLAKVVTVDEVLYFHNAFLDKCLRECLLTSHDLILVLSKLMEASLKFAQNVDTFFANAKLAPANNEAPEADKKVETTPQRRIRIKVSGEHIRNVVTSSAYASMVTAFVTRFDQKLVEFLTLLRTKSSSAFDNHLANLLTRLNFNDYFEKT